MTYDTAVYRVRVSTEDYVDVGGFKSLIREMGASASNVEAKVIDTLNEETAQEYIVVVRADAYAHPRVQEKMGSYADHIPGATSRVEAADVTVGTT